MNNGEFREWLKGFFELSEDDVLISPRQLQIIVNHLDLAESVSGELDTLNGQMRAEIDAFRTKPVRTPDEFASLTQSLRQHVLDA